MAAPALDPGRGQFQRRLLTQLRSRYPAWSLDPAPEGFGIRARKERARVHMSLETLYQTCRRPEASVPAEISRFVAAAGPRLAAAESAPAAEGAALDPESLVWCVRLERTVLGYSRAPELVTRPLPAGLIAFVSESLPGEVMRGVSAEEALGQGLDRERLAQLADQNTSTRLSRWREVLESPPGQRRWLFTHDVLFSSSLLLVPEFLAGVAALGEGEAVLLVPDRGVVVAAVREAAEPDQVRHLARRLYGLAKSPLVPTALVTDGTQLLLHPAESAPRRSWPGWRRALGLGGS